MKIMINGIIRDMTAEEEAAYLADRATDGEPPEEATSEDYEAALNELGVKL